MNKLSEEELSQLVEEVQQKPIYETRRSLKLARPKSLNPLRLGWALQGFALGVFLGIVLGLS